MASCLQCWRMLENSCQGLVQTLHTGACFLFGTLSVLGDDRMQDLQDLPECKQAGSAGRRHKSLRA